MASPPLIVHVIHHLFMGGMENGLVNLINRIPPDRYRHCVVCAEDFSNFSDRIERSDVQVLAMNKSTVTRVQLSQRLHATFMKLRPAIVHSRNLSGLDALLPAWACGVPVRIHGEHGWDVGDLDGSRLKPRFLRRLHSPFVHRYTTVSKDLQNYLTRKIGVSASRITQIYNGVDTDRFAASSNKPTGIMPPGFYGQDIVVIGTVGRLQEVKDQLALVRGFARLLRKEPAMRAFARLAIVGDGPMRNALLASVLEEGLEGLVWIPGARNDMERIYRCLDVFILPSLKEGISNTILEAMATALPVVATAVGGNPELVQDDVTGSLVRVSSPEALADALGRYIVSPGLRLQHGTAGRRRAISVFSVDAMVDSYVRLYDSLCPARS